ncbi:MAG: hypothetical protein GY801_50340 [bacterium]|nr:hypothetical protein [bacterium]
MDERHDDIGTVTIPEAVYRELSNIGAPEAVRQRQLETRQKRVASMSPDSLEYSIELPV